MKSPKEIERLALERFLSATNQEFIVEDSESPDFILKDGTKTIGCEITEFAPDYSPKGSKLRAREQFINKLHSKLREKIISKYPFGKDTWEFSLDTYRNEDLLHHLLGMEIPNYYRKDELFRAPHCNL